MVNEGNLNEQEQSNAEEECDYSEEFEQEYEESDEEKEEREQRMLIEILKQWDLSRQIKRKFIRGHTGEYLNERDISFLTIKKVYKVSDVDYTMDLINFSEEEDIDGSLIEESIDEIPIKITIKKDLNSSSHNIYAVFERDEEVFKIEILKM